MRDTNVTVSDSVGSGRPESLYSSDSGPPERLMSVLVARSASSGTSTTKYRISSPTMLVVKATPLVSRKVGGLVGMKVKRNCQSSSKPV